MTESATPRNLTPNEDGEMVCRTCGGHDGHFDDCPTTWTDADLTPEEREYRYREVE